MDRFFESANPGVQLTYSAGVSVDLYICAQRHNNYLLIYFI